MISCNDCKHCKMDILWGEYKCLKKERKIPDIHEAEGCEDFRSNYKKKSSREVSDGETD